MAETFLLDAIDALLFSENETILSETEVDALQHQWCNSFMEQHARSGSLYLKWAERRNATVARAPGDIPLVPTSIFKSMNLLSIEDDMVEQWCISSGTLGTTSRVGRDRATLDRLIGSLRYGLLMLPKHYEEETEIVHLGPSHADAGDIWFPYVMSLTELRRFGSHPSCALCSRSRGHPDWSAIRSAATGRLCANPTAD
jgi:long-chain-fatty-acid---luciferin-component ligase